MFKKILIVNDDGIQSEGLKKLAEAALRYGRVWTVAPTDQCSAMSQKIVGAAMEALMQGIPAIAFSNGYNGSFGTADAYLSLLLEDLILAPPSGNEIWNVNFPGIPLEECRGILTDCSIAPLQLYRDGFLRDELRDGAFTLHNRGIQTMAEEAPEGTDIHAVLNGYISIGTVRCSVL